MAATEQAVLERAFVMLAHGIEPWPELDLRQRSGPAWRRRCGSRAPDTARSALDRPRTATTAGARRFSTAAPTGTGLEQAPGRDRRADSRASATAGAGRATAAFSRKIVSDTLPAHGPGCAPHAGPSRHRGGNPGLAARAAGRLHAGNGIASANVEVEYHGRGVVGLGGSHRGHAPARRSGADTCGHAPDGQYPEMT